MVIVKFGTILFIVMTLWHSYIYLQLYFVTIVIVLVTFAAELERK
jgi:hypothetical protein